MENTIGDVPIQWFRDEEHIGYEVDGRKILKRARVDHLDHLLQMVDDPTYWRKVFDEREDKEIYLERTGASRAATIVRSSPVPRPRSSCRR